MEIGDPKSDLGNPAVENLAKFSRGLRLEADAEDRTIIAALKCVSESSVVPPGLD
jgi:hypothetical protein